MTVRLSLGAIIAALWLLVSTRAHAQSLELPVVVQNGRIVVRAEPRLASDAHRIASRAPATLASIAKDLKGLPEPGAVEIRLIHWASDIAAASPPGAHPPSWAMGVAYPDAGVVVVAERVGPTVTDMDSVVTHELAHLALHTAMRGAPVPRWLDEGFAFLHSSEWSFERTQTLIGLAWGGAVPWGDIDRYYPREETVVSRAYAQSWDFVAFLARRGRYKHKRDDPDRFALRVFLASLASGQRIDAAARDAFGVSFHDLTAEWYADLRDRYLTIPASLFGLGIWVLASILLVFGFVRRRRQKRAKLALWEQQEQEAMARVEPGV